jgi:hypothetical protein
MAYSFVEWNHAKVVLDIVMLCAKHSIALWGHREGEEALNKGNFLDYFKFISKYDPKSINCLTERNTRFQEDQYGVMRAAACLPGSRTSERINAGPM